MDNSLVTWLLVVVCTPHCIRNPYLIAKIIEVLFVINPNVQVSIYTHIYTHIYIYIQSWAELSGQSVNVEKNQMKL